MYFINNAEMAALASEGFAKQEITTVENGGTTTLKGDDIKNATTVKDIFDRVVALKG